MDAGSKASKTLEHFGFLLRNYTATFTDYVRKTKPRNLAAIKYKNVLCQRIPAKKINDLAATFLYQLVRNRSLRKKLINTLFITLFIIM